MTNKQFCTIPELAEHFQAPQWKVRQIVDLLGAAGANIQRAGLVRIVPNEVIPLIGEKLHGQTVAPQIA
jgi:hypothetical protein